MIEIKHLEKEFGKVKALKGISFEVEEGEIFGLLGVNGAGKTTTFRIILSIIEQDMGEVLLDGETVTISMSKDFGYLPEERSLFQKQKIIDQVIYLAKLKGLSTQDAMVQFEYWMDRLNMKQYIHKKAKELSKGNQQKIAFIVALLHDPKVIIMDEPFTGLDPMNVKIFKELVKELKEKGKIVIFSSHRMEHIEELCTRLAILRDGEIILYGKLKDIKTSYKKKNVYVRGLEDASLLESIDGVESVQYNENEVVVVLKEMEYYPSVYKALGRFETITKIELEEPTLNDIFIELVGETYE